MIGTTGRHRCGECADQIEPALARVCALYVQAIRVLEDPCRDRPIRRRAQVVRSRLEFLFCGAGDPTFCPVFEPQQSNKGGPQKIVSTTEAQNFNALQIVEVTTRRFLGLHYAKVIAHARHIKRSPFLRDLDPYHVSRNIWGSKRVLKRRAQVGRSTQGI